ncbi:MAG: tail fiber domain-containing protein [Bacteroidales bacterium]|jgi:hypothetical protein|nr:tail fiber domain-containing protein [Bacteroidales bacterium]
MKKLIVIFLFLFCALSVVEAQQQAIKRVRDFQLEIHPDNSQSLLIDGPNFTAYKRLDLLGLKAWLNVDSLYVPVFDLLSVHSDTLVAHNERINAIIDSIKIHRILIDLNIDSNAAQNLRLIDLEGLDTLGIYHANRTDLNSVSGTNTGDQDLSSFATKLALTDSAAQVRSEIPDVSGFLSIEIDPLFSAWDMPKAQTYNRTLLVNNYELRVLADNGIIENLVTIDKLFVNEILYGIAAFNNSDFDVVDGTVAISDDYLKEETDSVFLAWDRNIGITVYESQILDLGNYETAFSKNTAFNKNFGTTSGTVTQGNDSRLSDARPASDVYAWAKASTKPTYTYSEVGAQIAGSYETAFSKNTAFNKNFGISSTTVAYGNHNHASDYDNFGYVSIGDGTTTEPIYSQDPFYILGGTGISTSLIGNQLTITNDISSSSFVPYTGATTTVNLGNNGVYAGESHFAFGTYSDPDAGTGRGIKIGAGGLAVNGTSKFNSAISVTGTVTATSTMTATNFQLSDRRLKTKIYPIDKKPVKIDYKQFELKSDRGHLRYGVIAQELQKTNPELVTETEKGMLAVNYIDLLIKEIAALKEQTKKLQKRVEKLEKNNRRR